jgi:hypothetical protein
VGYFGHRRSALGGAAALAFGLLLGGGPAASAAPAAPAAAPVFSITSNSQQDLFVQAIATPDAVVHIAGNVDLDLTGRESLPVAPGVQILGDHTQRAQGPRLFTTSFPSILLRVGNDGDGTHSDDVRISGIRLQGAESDDPFSAVDTSDSDGIRVNSSLNVEIDHSEIDHWRGAAVSIQDGQSRIGLQNARTVWVHDDYIHHNQHPTGAICCGHGAGYGVETSHGAYALVERNVFDYNRHAITGDGSAGDGYLAYRNLIWGGGGDNSYVWHTHEIDMHGNDSSCSYECGQAGEYMDVEYNTVWYTNGTGVKLRGTPSIGMTVSSSIPTCGWARSCRSTRRWTRPRAGCTSRPTPWTRTPAASASTATSTATASATPSSPPASPGGTSPVRWAGGGSTSTSRPPGSRTCRSATRTATGCAMSAIPAGCSSTPVRAPPRPP